MVSTTEKKRQKERVRRLNKVHGYCPAEKGPSKEDLRRMAQEAIDKMPKAAKPTPTASGPPK